MLSPRWRKVFRDLWRSKSRTILVVLSVAVGVLSVGIILNTQHILNTNFERGFDETNADALFLDVPNPYDYMVQVRQALKPGGFFGTILPTTNQVQLLLLALHRQQFAFVEVCEIMLRHYKPVSTRLRPTDRMVAHTGYLIFARPVTPEVAGENSKELPEAELESAEGGDV